MNCSISGEMLGKVELPIPPINVQERLVETLDNFDAICNDLNIGLPAEIRARKRQYEYYRDNSRCRMTKIQHEKQTRLHRVIEMSCCKGANSHIFPTLFAAGGLKWSQTNRSYNLQSTLQFQRFFAETQ